MKKEITLIVISLFIAGGPDKDGGNRSISEMVGNVTGPTPVVEMVRTTSR